MLGVPRGAVPMARIIASALDGELDVVLVRKLRAPFQPELAIGAVDEAGSVLKERYFNLAEVSEDYLREEIHTQLETLRRRRELYTGTRPPCNPVGRVVIIVDDGIATGSSMLAAIRSVRSQRPRKNIDVELLLQRVLDVNLRENPESLRLQCRRDPLDGSIKSGAGKALLEPDGIPRCSAMIIPTRL